MSNGFKLHLHLQLQAAPLRRGFTIDRHHLGGSVRFFFFVAGGFEGLAPVVAAAMLITYCIVHWGISENPTKSKRRQQPLQTSGKLCLQKAWCCVDVTSAPVTPENCYHNHPTCSARCRWCWRLASYVHNGGVVFLAANPGRYRG